MKKRKIQTGRLGMLPAMLTGFFLICVACSNEIEISSGNESADPGKEPYIYISGSGIDNLTANTKAIVGPGDNDEGADAPKIDGVCRADRLKIFFYRKSKSVIYENELVPVSEVQINELRFTKNDRWTQYNYNFKSDPVVNNWFSLLGFAYSEHNIDKFVVEAGANRTRPSLSLSSNGGMYHTPEVYCGMLGFDPEKLDVSYPEIQDNGAIKFYKSISANFTVPLYGRLYRIVSQLNVKITDIPFEEVECLDLYLTHYPTQITLHGTHGKYYPVTAVNDPAQTTGETPVLLASSGPLTNATVTLSSFLLPSEIGSNLKLKVTYKQPVTTPGETTFISTRVFDIHPAKSHFLTGMDADVYAVNDPNLKNDSDLYVYDGRHERYCFYSYSNVRVNLSGKFENYATSTSEADIVIEVEPNFEKEHTFEIK